MPLHRGWLTACSACHDFPLLVQLHERLGSYAQARDAYHRERSVWRAEVAALQAEAAAVAETAAAAPQSDQGTKDQDASLKLPDPPASPTVLRGLYLWGGVGTGKSMLMDALYNQAPVLPAVKRRVHFHQFMIEVHERLHVWQEERIRTHGRQSKLQFGNEGDSVYQVGLQLGTELVLLCFDEFQVSDVADALIIRRLFSALFAEGVVVVATSNRLPEQLYEAGLNRSYFEPFIPLLRDKCIVHAMASDTDHRRLVTAATGNDGQQLYFTAADGRAAFEAAWEQLVASEMRETAGNGAAKENLIGPRNVTVRQGRQLLVPQAIGGVCRFDYTDLCASDVGAADFAAVAATFHTVVLDNLPQLRTARHNEAARFVTLVDELYEQRCRLGCYALTALSALFDAEQEVTITDDAAPASPFVIGSVPQPLPNSDPVLSTAATNKSGGGASGEVLMAVDPASEDLAVSGAEFAAIHELRLAFARAESRRALLLSLRHAFSHLHLASRSQSMSL